MHTPAPQNFALRSEPACEKYVFLLLEGFTHLAFACAIEPLRLANLASGRILFDWRAISVSGASARSSSGIAVEVQGGVDDLKREETLVVVGGVAPPAQDLDRVIRALRREHAHGRRIMAICGAVSVLAESGLLDGRVCAVHWQVAHAFSERFPKVRVRLDAFVDQGIPTASGGAAAADLIVAKIRDRHGAALARQVADLMVYRSVREADAPQTSSLMYHVPGRNPRLATILRLMEATLDNPLRTSELAERAGVGVRQMERLFRRAMQTTPNSHYMQLRLNRARDLLVQTELSVTEIAVATGFASPSHFSKVFRARFGVSAHSGRNLPASRHSAVQ